MTAKKPQSPRPDQLWPEGVPHPTSPAPPDTRKHKPSVIGLKGEMPPIPPAAFRSDEERRDYETELERWASKMSSDSERILIHHDREHRRLEVLRSGRTTDRGTYHQWLPGLPGDCGVIRNSETDEIVGIRMKVATDAATELHSFAPTPTTPQP